MTVGFQPLLINLPPAFATGTLRLHHRDPHDRMLFAQAIAKLGCLVTCDSATTRFSVSQILAWNRRCGNFVSYCATRDHDGEKP